MANIDLLREAKRVVEAARYPNVQGVFIGYKFRAGQNTREQAIVVYVSKKMSEMSLRTVDVIPKVISLSGGDVPTDVIEGTFKALTLVGHSPVTPGYSVGHPDVTAGTLSFFAKRNGKICLISNAHVIANTNSGKVGDPTFFPGVYDGGTKKDTVAHLIDTVPIEMMESACPVANAYVAIGNFISKIFRRKSRFPNPVRYVTNIVDCAAAEMIEGVEISEDIYKIGKPIGLQEAELGMKVQKSGRTTEYTEGEITGIEGTVYVSYGEEGTAIFENQIVSDIPSAGGDSGSAILTYDNKLIGLLFAGGSGSTILNPIAQVFWELELELL